MFLLILSNNFERKVNAMVYKKIFKVIKNNLECAFCKEPNCPLRYEPDHSMILGGTRLGCKKDFEKREKEVFGKKLP